MSDAAISDFFNAWEVYDQVLEHNYMFHDEVHRDLAALLSKRFPTVALRVLDLGCGSARHMAATLRPLGLRRYVGCDIAAVALEYAQRSLAGLQAEVVLREVDLFEALRTEHDTFELVFAGYALHHLLPEEKARFFAEARPRVSPSGALVVLDMVRGEDEEREHFLREYCRWVEDDWSDLSAGAIAGIRDHVMSADYPASRTELADAAREAGFGTAQVIGTYGRHQALLFAH